MRKNTHAKPVHAKRNRITSPILNPREVGANLKKKAADKARAAKKEPIPPFMTVTVTGIVTQREWKDYCVNAISNHVEDYRKDTYERALQNAGYTKETFLQAVMTDPKFIKTVHDYIRSNMNADNLGKGGRVTLDEFVYVSDMSNKEAPVFYKFMNTLSSVERVIDKEESAIADAENAARNYEKSLDDARKLLAKAGYSITMMPGLVPNNPKKVAKAQPIPSGWKKSALPVAGYGKKKKKKRGPRPSRR